MPPLWHSPWELLIVTDHSSWSSDENVKVIHIIKINWVVSNKYLRNAPYRYVAHRLASPTALTHGMCNSCWRLGAVVGSGRNRAGSFCSAIVVFWLCDSWVSIIDKFWVDSCHYKSCTDFGVGYEKMNCFQNLTLRIHWLRKNQVTTNMVPRLIRLWRSERLLALNVQVM